MAASNIEQLTTGVDVWGVIQGRSISFPMHVADANVATLLYTVPVSAASELLPGTAFEVVETAPGQTQLIVAACDYRDNPWGDYNEINLGFLARPAGAGDDATGSFVYRMPVNQAFTCEAGNRVMGFPKSVEVIDVHYTGADVTFVLTFQGERALALTVPRVPTSVAATRIAAVSYSYLDGAPYGTTLEMDMGAPVEDPSCVHLELGQGVVADELTSLGLPTTPDYASWGEGLGAVFHLGHPVSEPSSVEDGVPTS
jgi:hypothetical protein